MAQNNKPEEEPRVIPGMRSDSEPQPREDPDFGRGMEYESGDMDRDFSEAEKIRKQWKKGQSDEGSSTPEAPDERKAG